MSFASGVKEISAKNLNEQIKGGKSPVILDVRESHELDICRLANIVHIPLGELPSRINELNSYKAQDIVVYCRSGKRSERACQFLSASGFNSVQNLTGGILAWAKDIDPQMESY